MSSASGADVPSGSHRGSRTDEILLEVLELPPARRHQRLVEICGEDLALRAGVEHLLDADSALVDRLEVPAFEHVERWRARDRIGEQAGDFRICRLLGRGGTSSVFLGRRVRGLGPEQVAIKVLATSPVDDAAEKRFLQEGDLLARLCHPNIASILGGGVCDDGAPFLVLEYVEGVPLDRWCAEAGLSIRQRLRLLLEICGAVSHAHTKLIVHRDLKPANILVTPDGVPKLLDFGISKLLDPAAGAVATATAFRMLTPEYASPEQLRFQGTNVATDVYALGIVMFEILVGERPFRRENDTESLYRAILEHPAPKPSRAYLAVARAPANRERWSKRLAGDLDAIVLQCLEKSPEDRYDSPLMLASDISRHLDSLPVKARTPTLRYRFGKLARRRWRELVFATTLVVFVGIRLLDLESIRKERDRATLIRDFLVEVLREASPTESRGDELSLRDILDQSVERLGRFDQQPELKTFFLHFYGDIYTTIGDLDTATSLLEEAAQRVESGDGGDLPAILNSLAASKYAQGHPKESGAILLRALTLLAKADEDPRLRFQMLQNLGLALADLGRFSEAERHLREALKLSWQHSLAIKDQALGWNNLGFCHYGQGRMDEALVAFRKSAGLRRQALGPHHPEYAIAVSNMAAVALAAGRPAESATAFEEALGVWHARAPSNPIVAVLQNNLGKAQQSLGDLVSAESSFKAAVDLHRRISGPGHPEAAPPLNNLGSLLADLHRFKEALDVLNQAYRISAQRLGDHHPDTLAVLWNLLDVELLAGTPRAAEAALEARLDRAAADPDMPPELLRIGALTLSRLYRAHGQDAAAEGLERRFDDLIEDEHREPEP